MSDMLGIYYYKNKILYNVYYSKSDNVFLVPLNENAKRINLITEPWKTDHNNTRYVIFRHPLLKESVCIYEPEWLQNKEETIKENIDIDSQLFDDCEADGCNEIPELYPYNETDVINFLCTRYNLEYIIEPPQEINKLEHEHEPNDNDDDEPIPEVSEDREADGGDIESNNDIDFLGPIFNINYEEEESWSEIIREFNALQFLKVNPNTYPEDLKPIKPIEPNTEDDSKADSIYGNRVGWSSAPGCD
jgi:hypothetical protein